MQYFEDVKTFYLAKENSQKDILLFLFMSQFSKGLKYVI